MVARMIIGLVVTVVFIVLLLTIIEAYGALFQRTFAFPGIGHWAVIGFLEDLFAVGVLAGLATFTVIRLRNDPHRKGRASRFSGSHTTAAWVVLGMITAVIVTLLIYRAAQMNTGVFPYPHGWAFASWVVAQALHPLGYGVNSVLEATFILLLAVVLSFLVVVAYSKHLHIGLAPLNILFSRRPNGLGPVEPMRALPVQVPGVGDRQAAVAQAGHPGPARSRVRQGAVPAGDRPSASTCRPTCWPRRAARWWAARTSTG